MLYLKEKRICIKKVFVQDQEFIIELETKKLHHKNFRYKKLFPYVTKLFLEYQKKYIEK